MENGDDHRQKVKRKIKPVSGEEGGRDPANRVCASGSEASDAAYDWLVASES